MEGSMKRFWLFALLAVLGQASAQTGSANLTWTAPTQNTDGTALTNLSDYRIYWGTQQGSYPNAVTVPAPASGYVLTGLAPATYYFAVTARNSSGAESGYSNVASKTIAATSPTALAVSSTRIEAAEWTCRDSTGAILSSHTRQDTAQTACTNLALKNPGKSYELRPSGYRIVAQ